MLQVMRLSLSFLLLLETVGVQAATWTPIGKMLADGTACTAATNYQSRWNVSLSRIEVCYWNGSVGTWTAALSTAGGSTAPTQEQIFGQDGTFTVPAGVTTLYVTVVGGGGGAGSYAYGGGGGGASCIYNGASLLVKANGGGGTYNYNLAGQGQWINSKLTVASGQVLTIYVGGGGGAGGGSGNGGGGYGGGGAGNTGVGGAAGAVCGQQGGNTVPGGNGGTSYQGGGYGGGGGGGGGSGGSGGGVNGYGAFASCTGLASLGNTLVSSLLNPGVSSASWGGALFGGGCGVVKIRW